VIGDPVAVGGEEVESHPVCQSELESNPLVIGAVCAGINRESNAHNWFPQDHTGRTEPPTLNYKTVLDSTRWTVARGFLHR